MAEDETPKYELNINAIGELKEAIDKNITTLANEICTYDNIRKYIEIYRRKNRTHYVVSSEIVAKIQNELESLSPNCDEQYEEYLTATSRLQIMTDKTNRFATTNHLMQQEFLKVTQAIVNHFITINALEMARDDLLPLVGSEIILGKGRNTENESLELSHNVIRLFQCLLERNVGSAIENIEQLKKIDLPQEVFATLNKDIEGYLHNLNKAESIKEGIEELDFNKTLESTIAKEKNISLTFDSPHFTDNIN